MDNQRLHAHVHGLVQGVYFRDTTRQQAESLNINGWVRNRPDGSVEVTAEGSKPALDLLLKFLHKGPRHAQVDKVEETWSAATDEFSAFEVRW
jgi:acylphosphatase